MTSAKTDEATRAEWRALGFHYTRDDENREWRIEGAQEGLQRFSSCLRTFALDPASLKKSEHAHFGPYMYLEIMSWPEAGVDEHSIHGTPKDLLRLASIVERHARGLAPGSAVDVAAEYTSTSAYRLVLRAHPAGTDPASLDPQLSGGPLTLIRPPLVKGDTSPTA